MGPLKGLILLSSPDIGAVKNQSGVLLDQNSLGLARLDFAILLKTTIETFQRSQGCHVHCVGNLGRFWQRDRLRFHDLLDVRLNDLGLLFCDNSSLPVLHGFLFGTFQIFLINR